MYRLMFTGDIATGFRRQEVIERLAKLLDISTDAVERELFTGGPVEFKRLDDKEAAQQWRKDFAEAGAVLMVLGEQHPYAGADPAATQAEEPTPASVTARMPGVRRRNFAYMVLGALGMLLALVLILFASCSAALAEPAAPQVSLEDGRLVGKRLEHGFVSLHSFQGVPYAAPPVGERRWRAPQPVEAWEGIREAQEFGPRCMQRPLYSDMDFHRADGVSEDCLYLNIWRPAQSGEESGDKPLPVLVYFYGGGFLAGDGSEPRYDGASLAARGLVTVTVNYRLDVFGFLALPELAGESEHKATGNYGLLDQWAALRWVRDNIEQFGGDPKQITIGGESAGSMSVSAHMASPLSRDLIAGAIGQSGALIAPLRPQPRSEAERQGQALMRDLGVDSLAELRALPAQTLLDAVAEAGEGVRFAPSLDGWFLPEPPAQVFARGEQAQVPLLVGDNSQEGHYSWILGDAQPSPENYRAALKDIFGDQTERALELYPGDNPEQVKRSATALASDRFISHASWRWMDLHRRTAEAPVYFYYYDHPRPAKRDPEPGETPDEGAVHSAEIEYALGNLHGNPVFAWTQADREVSELMQSYFARFIKTGNPNGPVLPNWPAVAEVDGGLLRQTISEAPGTRVDGGAERHRFLREFYARQQP